MSCDVRKMNHLFLRSNNLSLHYLIAFMFLIHFMIVWRQEGHFKVVTNFRAEGCVHINGKKYNVDFIYDSNVKTYLESKESIFCVEVGSNMSISLSFKKKHWIEVTFNFRTCTFLNFPELRNQKTMYLLRCLIYRVFCK